MAELRGYEGHVDLATLIDSDAGWGTHSWSVDVGAETHDTTSFDSTGWKKFLAGLKSWTATVELYTGSDATYRIAPSDLGTEYVGRFYFDGTDKVGLTGKCLLSGWSPAVSVDGVQTQSLSLQGSSDLTNF